MVNAPVHGIRTIYNRIGDLLPFTAIVFVAYILFEMVLKIFKKRRAVSNKEKTKVVGV